MTIIDGHNLYFALDRVDENHFEKGLENLINDLRVRCRRGTNLLVLDGSGGHHPNGSERDLSEHLRVIQSGKISADEWIVNWLCHKGSSGVTLVTGDMKLYKRVSTKKLKRADPVSWFSQLKKSRSNHRVVKDHHPQNKPSSVGSVDDWLEYFGEKD